MRIYSVGSLSVWADPDNGAVMLGNEESAFQASTKQPHHNCIASCDFPAIPNEVPDHMSVYAPLGVNGQAVMLRMWGRAPDEALMGLIDDSRTERAHQAVLDVVYQSDGRRGLWRDGVASLIDQPLIDSDDGRRFDLVGELLISAAGEANAAAVIHGAAVVWREVGIALVGRSGTGKSTLAAALCADGGLYLSDDTILLRTEDGAAYPCLLRPSFKSGSWPLIDSLFPKLIHAPIFSKGSLLFKHLQAAPRATLPKKLNLLIFPCYAPNSKPHVTKLDTTEALLIMSQSGLWTNGPMLGAFLSAISRMWAYKIQYNTTECAMGQIKDIKKSGYTG